MGPFDIQDVDEWHGKDQKDHVSRNVGDTHDEVKHRDVSTHARLQTVTELAKRAANVELRDDIADV